MLSHARIRNVKIISFEFRVEEWDYLDGIHPAVNIEWFAAEMGLYKDSYGRDFEISKFDTKKS